MHNLVTRKNSSVSYIKSVKVTPLCPLILHLMIMVSRKKLKIRYTDRILAISIRTGRISFKLRWIIKKAPQLPEGLRFKVGDDLLSHFRSTIGAGGLNFSVRNGKRWSPTAIVTLRLLIPYDKLVLKVNKIYPESLRVISTARL